MRREFGAFWGCFISGRFPFMEKASRLVMQSLDFDFRDIDGFTCCPDKSVVLTESEEEWRVTAARNLAVAEAAGVNLFAPCNGCVGTLKCVHQELAQDSVLLKKVNARLDSIGRHYGASVEVLHWVDVLHDQIGTGAIRKRVTDPLTGMKIAVHAGCHQARPSRELQRDIPLNPAKFDKLVEAAGGISLEYETKLLCCGGTMNTYGYPERARQMTRRKLVELQELGADCLTTTCPACLMQYDTSQFAMQRAGEDLHVPVLYLGELLALAFGLEEELRPGFKQHRISVEPFLEKWHATQAEKDEAYERFDLGAIERCLECRACSDICAPHLMDPRFDAHDLLEKVRDGKLEEAIADPSLWDCTECYECVERCFQNFGMLQALRKLKQLAVERGHAPEGLQSGLKAFHSTGQLTKAAQGPRKRLGLPETAKSGGRELKKLLRSSDAGGRQAKLGLDSRE